MKKCNVCGEEVTDLNDGMCSDCFKNYLEQCKFGTEFEINCIKCDMACNDACDEYDDIEIELIDEDYNKTEGGYIEADYLDDDDQDYDDFDSELIYDADLDPDELNITDSVSREIESLNRCEDSISDGYGDFIDDAMEYATLRRELRSNPNHKADYDKLIEFYRYDILKGLYKIGLASELTDEDIVVDASRGVVVYENRRNRG